MKVLGNHLYSTPQVALRELVQNAHDSCIRRQLEDPGFDSPCIRVSCDPQRKQLMIDDNGAGLTRQEIVDYLATVGRGYTGKLRQQGGPDNLIGAFGLGFLSAYFVARLVELRTASYQEPETAWHFSSKGSERFQIGASEARPVGTRVQLHLNDDSHDLADRECLLSLLRDYCGLLKIPVWLDDTPINLAVPWRQPDPNPLRQRHAELEFARQFERRFRPLCTIPLRPGGLQGLLWIQDGWSYGTSDRRNLSIYVRGMLISHDVRELLPEWAGFIGGVVESDQLTPTASREDLQRDAHWRAALSQLRESLVSGLSQLAERHPESWQQVLLRHGEALLGAALCEPDLFTWLSNQLRIPTSEGDLTAPVIVQRSAGKIFVSMGEQGGYEEVLFRAMRQPVVAGVRYGALAFCSLYAERCGGQLVKLGTQEGNRSLFPAAQLPPEQEARLRELLGVPGQQVVVARFQPPALPLVLVPDREVALKQRLARNEEKNPLNSKLLSLVTLYTNQVDERVQARLYVNADCPLVSKLLATAPERQPHLALLLRSVGELMSSRSDEAVGTDMGSTLANLAAALQELLDR